MRRKVSLIFADKTEAIPRLFTALGKGQAVVTEYDFEKRPGDENARVTFEVEFPNALGTAALITLLECQPGVTGIQVHQFS